VIFSKMKKKKTCSLKYIVFFYFLIDLKYVFLIKVKKNIGQGTIKIKKKKINKI